VPFLTGGADDADLVVEGFAAFDGVPPHLTHPGGVVGVHGGEEPAVARRQRRVQSEDPVVLLGPDQFPAAGIELEAAEVGGALGVGQPAPARLQRLPLRLTLGDVDHHDPDPDDLAFQVDRVVARQGQAGARGVEERRAVDLLVQDGFPAVEHSPVHRLDERPQVGDDRGDGPADLLGDRRSVGCRQHLVEAHDAKVPIDESETDGCIGEHRLEHGEGLRGRPLRLAQPGLGPPGIVDVGGGADPVHHLAVLVAARQAAERVPSVRAVEAAEPEVEAEEGLGPGGLRPRQFESPGVVGVHQAHPEVPPGLRCRGKPAVGRSLLVEVLGRPVTSADPHDVRDRLGDPVEVGVAERAIVRGEGRDGRHVTHPIGTLKATLKRSEPRGKGRWTR
jgi:hypothetical protein